MENFKTLKEKKNGKDLNGSPGRKRLKSKIHHRDNIQARAVEVPPALHMPAQGRLVEPRLEEE
jgi:hypothetical protein